MTQRVLVTGGTGFTGGHLCRRLVETGHEVRALVRDPGRAARLRAWGVDLATGDLRDRDSLRRAAEGVDVVYHIAASFRQEKISHEEMWAINAEGTRNMLDAAVAEGVGRFVHCSTVGVHGDVKEPPATEAAPYSPSDHYQESKLAGERYALEYMEAGRLPVVIFRPGGIYGPGDHRFLKLFKSIQKRTFVMFGSGEVLYQLIYIDDLVDGIIRCGTCERAVGNVYLLTGEEPITLNQFVAAIADVLDVPRPRWRLPVTPLYLASYLCELACRPLGIEPPIYRRRVDFFRKDRAFSIEKARRELDFRPRVDTHTGLHRTAAWYREQGLL